MIWRIGIVFLTAAVKFLFAPLTSRGLGFDALSTALTVATGGITSIIAFYFLAQRILRYSQRKKVLKSLEPNYKKPKYFTRTNKLLVLIKRSLGLYGFVFLTLPFISIPLCTIIAAKFYRHRLDTLPTLAISCLIWTGILTTLVFFF